MNCRELEGSRAVAGRPDHGRERRARVGERAAASVGPGAVRDAALYWCDRGGTAHRPATDPARRPR
ncbi:MAG: hypothetical protein ABEJ23_10655 [Haloarculaceae archaeon]